MTLKQNGQSLHDNGFHIIPIKPTTKQPGEYFDGFWRLLDGWSLHCTEKPKDVQIHQWKGWPDAGVGICCGEVVGVDIDVLDHDLSIKLQNIAFTYLGQTPCIRIGQAPKRLLVYRTDEPFKKMSAKPIDILGLGSQFIAYGIHPATHRFYEWPEESLANTDIKDLPTITIDQVNKFLEAAQAIIPDSMKPRKITINTNTTPSQDGLQGNKDAARAAIAAITTASLWEDYHEWIRIGQAIKGAMGEDGLDDWHAFSKRSQQYDHDETQKKWDSFSPSSIGMGSLVKIAQDDGWQPPHDIRFKDEPDHNITINVDAMMANQLAKEQARAKAENAQFEKQKAQIVEQEARNDFPTHCLQVDGLLKDVTDWINACALKPHPVLALFNAIAMCGAIYGRKYASPWNTRPNVFMVGLAPTASGKDHSRSCIKTLLSQSSANHLGGDDVASGRAIHVALEREPHSCICHFDEFGLKLKSITDPKAAGHEKAIMKTVMEIYSASNTVFLGTERATNQEKRPDIIWPHLSIFGTSTSETFMEALRGAHVSSGLLNRFIVTHTLVDYPEKQDPTDSMPSLELCQLVADHAAAEPKDAISRGNLSGKTEGSLPPLKTVPWGDGSKDFADNLDKQQTTMLKIKGPLSALWGRFVENTIKLALIRSISKDPITPIIAIEDLEWAKEIVSWSIGSMVTRAEAHMSENAYEGSVKEVEAFIARYKEGVSMTAISRSFTKIRKNERREILADLVDMGKITEEVIKKEGAGRPSSVYRVV